MHIQAPPPTHPVQASMIDLDATMLFQLGLFVVAFLVLRRLLFKPVIDMIEERRRRTVTLKEEAEAAKARAEARLAELDRQLAEARSAAREEEKRIRDAAWQAGQDALARTRKEASEGMARSREKLAAEANAIQAELERDVDTFASSIASRLLGRDVGPSGPTGTGGAS